ncbi:MAG: tyrosine-type recombinase/integrase [Candidatus Thorarchaeota archaeon]|jgi:site-specific recombinase XerD
MSNIVKYLTENEATALKIAVSKRGNLRDILIIEILLCYGLRVSELRLLKINHIDLEEKTIFLPRLKNGISNIWPLFQSVEAVLLDYLPSRSTYSDILFPSNITGKALTRKAIWDIIQKYGRFAAIPKEKRHPHACRHTVGVRALDAGLSMEEVQDLLGHRSITSTQIYARITDARRKRAFDKLEEANG